MAGKEALDIRLAGGLYIVTGLLYIDAIEGAYKAFLDKRRRNFAGKLHTTAKFRVNAGSNCGIMGSNDKIIDLAEKQDRTRGITVDVNIELVVVDLKSRSLKIFVMCSSHKWAASGWPLRAWSTGRT